MDGFENSERWVSTSYFKYSVYDEINVLAIITWKDKTFKTVWFFMVVRDIYLDSLSPTFNLRLPFP